MIRAAKPKSTATGARSGRNSRDDLRREHQLVRSAGTIPKRVMAVAFGVVFILAGVGAAITTRSWAIAGLLVGIGLAAIAWAIYATVQPPRQRTDRRDSL